MHLVHTHSVILVTQCPVLLKHWSWSGTTLLSCKFSLPWDKRLTLYSPRPSLPTFSLMFITSLNFKYQTSTGYFQLPHTTKSSNKLFVFNQIIKSCHSNKKPNLETVTLMMTSLPQVCRRYYWQILSSCGLTVFYV